MPRRRDSTLFAGLCLSLVAHGGLAGITLTIYNAQLEGRLPQPPFDRVAILADSAAYQPNNFSLGEASGTGTAIAPIDAYTPQFAPDANQDQPFTSLDAAGDAQRGVPPSPVALPGDSDVTTPATFGMQTESTDAPPKLIRPDSAVAQKIDKPLSDVEPTNENDGPLTAAVAKPEPQVEVSVEQSSPQPPTPEQPQQVAGTPVAADPAPQSDSEIDAFAADGVAEFKSGKTDVQFGRKTKLTRPRVLLAGQFDLIGAAGPRVVLEIHTSTTGKVTDVSIAKSSGSRNIDDPVRLAAYDWWFEPPLGPNGKPLPSEFLFTVSIVGG